MSRSPLPLVIEDLSAFATQLRKSWPAEPPGQSQTLSLIARAAGYRNHQHLRADVEDDGAPDRNAQKRITDALRVFDDNGVMQRWPKKTSVQRLCLLWFWSRLPAKRDLSEAEVNEVLQAGEAFGDHVLLRRSLIDGRLVTRTNDGQVYRRLEAAPTPEERQVIRALSERQLAAKV